MAYNGIGFVFDGVPSEEYGLIMYDLTYNSQTEKTIVPKVNVFSDKVSTRYESMLYGIAQNEPLEFTMTFGANPVIGSRQISYDRYDISAIATWLTGHKTYKWLEITMPDMVTVRYKCLITSLSFVDVNYSHRAFRCTVLCDSPFAYSYPETTNYLINGTSNIVFRNRSAYNGYYYPKLIISIDSGFGTFSIINHSDNDREMKFTNVPSTPLTITADCNSQTLTSTSGLNLFPYFNFSFLRLIRGDNNLEIAGRASVKFICEFPMGVGTV